MEYAIGYMVSVFVFQAIAAIRTPREDFQVAFVATVFWPFILVLLAGSALLDWTGWGFDMVKGAGMFGARKPTNTEVRGFAVTLFYIEFQMWKKRTT